MKIPQKVNIGGIIYKVKLISGTPKNDLQERNYLGRIDHCKCEITLEKDADKQVIESTFIHEIAHGLEYKFKMEIAEDDIDRIANGFYQVLKENNFLKD